MLLANAHRILEAKGACNLLSNGSEKCVYVCIARQRQSGRGGKERMTNMAKSYKLVTLDKGYTGVLLTIFQANFKIKSYLKICYCITLWMY